MQSLCISGQCYFQRNLFEIVLSYMLSDWKLSSDQEVRSLKSGHLGVIQLLMELNLTVRFCKRRNREFSNCPQYKNFLY